MERIELAQESEKLVQMERVLEDGPAATVYEFVDSERDFRIKCKAVSKKSDSVTYFPWYYDRRSEEVLRKFPLELTFEGLQGNIPSGFRKVPKSGYGFTTATGSLRKFLDKQLHVEKITISKKRKTAISGSSLVLQHKDYETLRKAISSISSQKKAETEAILASFFFQWFPTKVPTKPIIYQKGTISRLLSQYSRIERLLSIDDKKALAELFTRLSISDQGLVQKDELITTKVKIEKRFIEDVLTEFEQLLGRKRVTEERWQDFFKANSWIFSQLFSYPTVLIGDKVYVGGKSISNSGGNVADFLYVNNLTRNSVIIEIKKHNTALLMKTAYRGTHVFGPSKDAAGAVSQVLEQKHSFHKDIRSLKEDANVDDFESFNTDCIVIAGSLSQLSKTERKSFELFRRNLRDVMFVTYDELFERIQSTLRIFNILDEL